MNTTGHYLAQLRGAGISLIYPLLKRYPLISILFTPPYIKSPLRYCFYPHTPCFIWGTTSALWPQTTKKKEVRKTVILRSEIRFSAFPGGGGPRFFARLFYLDSDYPPKARKKQKGRIGGIG